MKIKRKLRKIPRVTLLFILVIVSGSASCIEDSSGKEVYINLEGDITFFKQDVLVLVNDNNRLSNDYAVHLVKFNGYMVASILVDDLTKMYNEAYSEGINLTINNAYRDQDEQKEILDARVSSYVSQGYSKDEALRESLKIVAAPGYSEHETGLAIDFSSLDPEENRAMWAWLNNNAYKYGFIRRYPPDKVSITGISYEAWHYRYVGREVAKIIYENDICFEEYFLLGG